VTGTNGKTTTTHLIEYFLSQAGIPTALFGTLYTRWQGFQETANHTTPFANELQASLAKAVSAGNEIAVMEVSSHALDQGRVQGCTFPVTVFTNLTRTISIITSIWRIILPLKLNYLVPIICKVRRLLTLMMPMVNV
jgi:UDP-N-acetylmuramoyl-L-alanyl-D-glutamate--2,6-diaminopimelate ligase